MNCFLERRVRGPLDLLRQNWEKYEIDPETVLTYMYNLLNTLKSALNSAGENLQQAQTQQKTWYDKRARERKYNPGDEVLIQHPVRGNMLQMA